MGVKRVNCATHDGPYVLLETYYCSRCGVKWDVIADSVSLGIHYLPIEVCTGCIKGGATGCTAECGGQLVFGFAAEVPA